MFGGVWLFVLIAACVACSNAATIKKKIKDESTATTESIAPKSVKFVKSTTPAPAILAIEIVDENEPEEGSKKNTSKRTIDGSLGYGGFNHNYFGTTRNEVPKKFEIYPYSQQDIPPLKTSHQSSIFGHGINHHGGGHSSSISHGNTQFDIQKSVAYDLGTHTTRIKSPHISSPVKYQSNYFQQKPSSSSSSSFLPSKQHSQHQTLNPGTTLYTLVDQGGHAGHLSSNFPPSIQSGSGHRGAAPQHGSPQVPVIVLRVYPSQLQGHGAIYPNIPQSSPYSNLNSINLQSLLSGYLNQHGYQVQPGGQSDYYADYPEQTYTDYTSQQYHQPESHSPVHKYTSSSGTGPQVFPRSKQQPIAENYPDDAHTRVVFTAEPGSGYKSASHDSARPVTLPSHQPPQYHHQNQGYHSSKGSYSSGGKGQHHSSQKIVTGATVDTPVQYAYHTESQGSEPNYIYEDIGQNTGASYYSNGVEYQEVYDPQPGANTHQQQYIEEDPTSNNQGYQRERIVHETNFPSSTPTPFNYHAHIASQGIKQQRNKKRNSVPVTQAPTGFKESLKVAKSKSSSASRSRT